MDSFGPLITITASFGNESVVIARAEHSFLLSRLQSQYDLPFVGFRDRRYTKPSRIKFEPRFTALGTSVISDFRFQYFPNFEILRPDFRL